MTASSSGQTAQSSSTGARRPLTILDLDDSAPGSHHHPGTAGPVGRLSIGVEPHVDLERADSAIELARVKSADADVRIVRAAGYVRVVEEALRKTAGGRNAELEAELARARDDLATAQREKAESEAENRLAEAQRHRAVYIKERRDETQERTTFRKVSFWQHGATYLLYLVMLMNIFITTFGITTGPVTPVSTTMPPRSKSPPAATYLVSSPTAQMRHNVSDMVFA